MMKIQKSKLEYLLIIFINLNMNISLNHRTPKWICMAQYDNIKKIF